MDVNAIGAIGNVVAATGVMISLAYLGLQIRNQVREARVKAVHQLTENFRSFLQSLAESEQLANIWIHGIKDFESLAAVDRLRLSCALGNAFRIFDNLYNHYLEGFIDTDAWQSLEVPIDDLIAYPGIQAWWATRRHWYTERYRSRVDDKIHQAATPRMYGEDAVGKA